MNEQLVHQVHSNAALFQRHKDLTDTTSCSLKGPLAPLSPIKITVMPAANPLNNQQNTLLETSTNDSFGKKQLLQAGSQRKKSPRGEIPVRKDRMGKVIDRVIKKHRVTFRDAVIGGNVADVNEVESYKDYNSLTEVKKGDGCGCILL